MEIRPIVIPRNVIREIPPPSIRETPPPVVSTLERPVIDVPSGQDRTLGEFAFTIPVATVNAIKDSVRRTFIQHS